MNCKDLMIDDLVKFAVRHLKVLSVSSCEVKVKDAYGEIFNVRDFSEIYPIPLTEEILKANGWEKNKFRSAYINHRVPFRLDIGICCLWLNNEWDDYYNAFSFNYVHELQHALRLCGLNDLADNFKIKQQ